MARRKRGEDAPCFLNPEPERDHAHFPTRPRALVAKPSGQRALRPDPVAEQERDRQGHTAQGRTLGPASRERKTAGTEAVVPQAEPAGRAGKRNSRAASTASLFRAAVGDLTLPGFCRRPKACREPQRRRPAPDRSWPVAATWRDSIVDSCYTKIAAWSWPRFLFLRT